MTKISLAVASAALAIGMAAPVLAAQTDPEIIIYRFPGVRDDGGAPSAGIATVFHCTNFSGATETIRFATRFTDGSLASNVTTSIPHLATRLASTHDTVAYNFEELIFLVGTINHGTTAIAATSINIICTAMTIDASTSAPVGVALRGIRFNPVPGSQE